MPENILVVEYEPRYTDRVRQALAGQPFTPCFAKDGDEAMRSLESQTPRLIVLSSVVPRVSTPELVRAIRGRNGLAETPILLTVSGYNGKSPRQDALRLGVSDILPKPYSESEFLGKVQQMLGIRTEAGGAKAWAPELDPEFTARPVPASEEGHITSNEIFGELLDDHSAAPAGARKPMKPKDDVDKMLADTLAGVMPQKKKDASPPTVPGTVAVPKPTAPAAPAVDPRAKTQAGTTSYDRLLSDTLSGLERNARKPNAPATPAAAPTVAQPAPQPAVVPPPPPVAAKPAAAPAAAYQTDRIPVAIPEKIPVSQPIFPKAPEPPLEEEEPTDGIKFGQYVLLEKIATGGMAEVWKARMRGVEGFQKIVAIKKILPHLSDNQDFIEMFVDEAKLAAQLNHNNIIHIYDLGKIQSSYYIAMEYIDGHDLKTILKRGEERDQPMSVELGLFIASKIASALDYAHRKHDFEGKDLGLVHRDVSPQNVLVSQDGDIKLCDFGIAKAASKASHTQAGALKGKLQYMSPEQAWGRSIDKRSDIFALATVLYEMLTGKKLFTGDNELSILEQVREARVTSPSQLNEEVTPQIDRIVIKALQKDPAARYQTAGEMAKDLDAVLYSFKPTPTSADLAIYMHRIWSPEPAMPPMHEPEPVPVVEAKPASAPVITPAVAPPPTMVIARPSVAAHVTHEEPPAKKAPVVPIAIAAVVVLAAVGGYFVMRGGKSSPSGAAATPGARTLARPSVAAVPTTSSPSMTTTASAVPVPTASGTQATTLDPAKINEEVQKRLAAERAKLEQTRAQQTQPAPSPAATARPVPTATQAAAAPAPVTPAPAPVPQPPAPVAESRPAPPAAEPAPARAQTGDLVSPGAAGLVPAHMTRQAPAPYPPMAKAQRIQGSVTLSVLVSETGQVLETRILSGVNRPVGINEAAEQSIRRSGFAPGTKDGARVKSWTTVRVDFKL